MAKYEGKGVIASTDYHSVRFEGMTTSKKYVKIEMAKAINMGNINWEFREKDDVVDAIVFTGVYDNTDENATSTIEPYTIDIETGIMNCGGSGEFYAEVVEAFEEELKELIINNLK